MKSLCNYSSLFLIFSRATITKNYSAVKLEPKKTFKDYPFLYEQVYHNLFALDALHEEL